MFTYKSSLKKIETESMQVQFFILYKDEQLLLEVITLRIILMWTQK